jgi:hypothetical protein
MYSVLLLTVMGLLIGSMACASQRRSDTLRTSLASVKAASTDFKAWDRQHQLDVVDKAASRPEMEAQLTKYREDRRPVAEGIEAAFLAIADAATRSDDPSLKAALAASTSVGEAVKRMIGGP